jgi:peptidoglycan hydrolase-like amidase
MTFLSPRHSHARRAMSRGISTVLLLCCTTGILATQADARDITVVNRLTNNADIAVNVVQLVNVQGQLTNALLDEKVIFNGLGKKMNVGSGQNVRFLYKDRRGNLYDTGYLDVQFSNEVVLDGVFNNRGQRVAVRMHFFQNGNYRTTRIARLRN